MSALSKPLKMTKYMIVCQRRRDSSPVRISTGAPSMLEAISGVLKMYGRTAVMGDFELFDVYEFQPDNSMKLVHNVDGPRDPKLLENATKVAELADPPKKHSAEEILDMVKQSNEPADDTAAPSDEVVENPDKFVERVRYTLEYL